MAAVEGKSALEGKSPQWVEEQELRIRDTFDLFDKGLFDLIYIYIEYLVERN